MITGWLLRVVLGIALAGFLVVELGSPLLARAQADDAAHEVANEAAFEYGRTNSYEGMQGRCREKAADTSVGLVSCELVDGRIAVTIEKKARSFLLDRFGPTKKWYRVQASAAAEPRD